jgi:hypothetical protein
MKPSRLAGANDQRLGRVKIQLIENFPELAEHLGG